MVENNQWRTEEHLYDSVIQNEINRHLHEAYIHYDNMRFKLVLKEVFFELMELKEEWLVMTTTPIKSLFVYYLQGLLTAMAPIVPHWADCLWRLKLTPFCLQHGFEIKPYLFCSDHTQEQRWSQVSYDLIISRKRSILQKTAHAMRLSLDNYNLKKKKTNEAHAENAAIIVAREFPSEHVHVISVMKSMGLTEDNSINGNMFDEIKKVIPDKKKLSNAIKFAKYWEVNEVKIRGHQALESKMS